MPVSLKSLLPALSDALGDDPGALYERQRALVRVGLLEFAPGKGPGSGVRATPESVAALVISRLASVNWAEAPTRAREIVTAQASSGRCSLTGATNFKDAFAAILSDERLAARVIEIRVTTSHGEAEIIYGKAQKATRTTKRSNYNIAITNDPNTFAASGNSVFTGPESKSPGLRVTISIGADRVREIANIVAGLPA